MQNHQKSWNNPLYIYIYIRKKSMKQNKKNKLNPKLSKMTQK
jgi:hypothetical protein